MKTIKNFILLLCLPFGLFSQVEGYVFDVETHERIAGVEIMDGMNNAAVTNKQGFFYIAKSLGDSLHVKCMGYKPTSLPISKTGELVVGLTPDFVKLEQVSVKAWGSSNRLSLITGNTMVLIRNNASENLAQVQENLQSVPGIDVQSGTFNTTKLIFRGIGSRSQYATFGVKAYLNNIPVVSGDGSLSLEDFAPALISRMEVVKGPASSLYGAGLGGVVKLNTVGESRTSVSFNSQWASHATQNYNLSLNLHKNKFNLYTAFSNLQSDGWRENSAFKRLNIFMMPTYTSGNLVLNGMFMFSRVFAHIPSSVNDTTFHKYPEMAAANWKASEGYEKYNRMISGMEGKVYLQPNVYLNASLFASHYSGLERRPFNTLEMNVTGMGSRSVLTLDYTLFDMLAGVEFLSENGESRLFETLDQGSGNAINQSGEKKDYAILFLMLKSDADRRFSWNVSGSFNKLNYAFSDRFETDSVDFSKSLDFNWKFSPRVGLGYQISNLENVYFSISSGYSPPTFEESLNSENVFNNDIMPATGLMFEGGLRGRQVFKSLYHDITLYYMSVSNLLVSRRISEDIFMNFNAGSSRHMGVELYLQHQWPLKKMENRFYLENNMSLSIGSFTFNKFIDNGNSYSGNRLPGVPEHTFSFNTETGWKNWFLTLNVKYRGEMYLTDANDVMSPSFSVVSMGAGKIIRMKQRVLEIGGGINNVFNTNYPAMVLINAPAFGSSLPRYYYPAMPRNYYIRLAVSIF